MKITKTRFGTTTETRAYLVSLGFEPFKKGLTSGEFSKPGLKARFGMGLAGKTGQSSTGCGWCFYVTVEDDLR